MTSPEAALRAYTRRQDGAVTTVQAHTAGVTKRQLRTLLATGWTHPARGVYVEPSPASPFRAGVRAALLVTPRSATYGLTAARLHGLWGLPLWSPREQPELIVPSASRLKQRNGMRLHFGLRPDDRAITAGLPSTTLARTVRHLSLILAFDDLVCLIDSALRLGWQPELGELSRRERVRLIAALDLADERSESALETLIRLLLRRSGLAPEVLQLKLFDRDGRCYARLDMAWPSKRLAVEADGKTHHEAPEALYRDRVRQNQLVLAGWTVLRFTWEDVLRRPTWVVEQVQTALLTAAIRRK